MNSVRGLRPPPGYFCSAEGINRVFGANAWNKGRVFPAMPFRGTLNVIGGHSPHLTTTKYTSRLEPLFQGGPPAVLPLTISSAISPLHSSQRTATCANHHCQGNPAGPGSTMARVDHHPGFLDLHRQIGESQRLRQQTLAK